MTVQPGQVYSPDRSLKGKLRRRWSRLVVRRPLTTRIDRPMVSFSFDDAPVTAVETGAAILEAAGARGVFYVCAGLDGQAGPMGRYADRDAYARLAAAGHEIGCHTFSHLDCGKADEAAIRADVARNGAALKAAGIETRTFAYPYGDVSPQAKAALGEGFLGLRALHPGLVQAGADLNQLPAISLEGADGEARSAAWIDRALADKAWVILYTHDVADPASEWGCTPGALQRLVARAQAGGAEIVTVAGALERLGAAQ